MSRHERSEYDVISFMPNLSVISVLCVLVPLGYSIFAREISYLLGGIPRTYFIYIVFGAIAFCVVGLAAGIAGLRWGSSRGIARVGVITNGFVLLLLILFVTLFRWIRYGNWT